MDSNKEVPADQEFSRALAIAKEALKYIGSFQTPPTPRVYELWYRFVEGNNLAFSKELLADVAADEVTLSRISDLYDRYFPPQVDYELNQRASQSLDSGVRGLQAVLHHQYGIGSSFQQRVEDASREIKTDPRSNELLGRCIAAVLSSNEGVQAQITETNRRVAETQHQISELRQELHESLRVMFTDSLTGIGNRRYFESEFNQAIVSFGEQSTSAPRGYGVALLLIDLDELKRINDTFGHAVGDKVLMYVAGELQRIAPDSSLARIGGDEFAVIQRCESANDAESLGDTIRLRFSRQAMVLKRSQCNVGQLTLSIGIALLRSSDSRESFFNRADQMLYVSKNGGRNRVSIEPRVGR